MEQLTKESARERFEQIYALMNEHDIGKLPEIFTEDVEFQDDAWPKLMKGHADVEEFISALWRAMPDLHFELAEGPYVSDDGRHAAARVRISGTLTGPIDPPGFAPTGSRVTTEFAAFYEVEDGRIKRERVILNMNDVGNQIGALPAPGSRGEKVGVLMQRLAARWIRRRAAAS